jgi:hypothetical protein
MICREKSPVDFELRASIRYESTIRVDLPS